MLASLAGVSKDEDVAEAEQEESSLDGDSARQSGDDQLEEPASDAINHRPGPFSDPHLRPLHLLDPTSDAASIERYLHKLEKDPHVDSRLLQEGLQASKRLSNDYTKGQQVISRSRGRSSAMETEVNPHSLNQEIDRRSMEQSRTNEKGIERTFNHSHTIVEAEGSPEAGLSAPARSLKLESRAKGRNSEHGIEDVLLDIKGDVSADTQKLGGLLHELGKPDLDKDLHNRVHDMGGALGTMESELHGSHFRQDLDESEQDVEVGLRRLKGGDFARDLEEDVHDFVAEVTDAERFVEAKLSGLDIRQAVQGGERELKEDLQRSGGTHLARNLRKGEYELNAGIKHAEKEVGEMLSGQGILQEVGQGEQELEHGLEVVKEIVDVNRSGSKLRQGLSIDERDRESGIRSIVKSAEDMTPDLHVQHNIQEGKHNLENSILQDVRTAGQAFSSLDVRREIEKVDQVLMSGFGEDINAVEREANKIESQVMVGGIGNNSGVVEHSLGGLGSAAAGQAGRDQYALSRDARVSGQPAGIVSMTVGRGADDGVRLSEHAVKQVVKAVPDVPSSDNRKTQDRGRVGSKGSSRRIEGPKSSDDMRMPPISDTLSHNRQHVLTHLRETGAGRGGPNGGRTGPVGDRDAEHIEVAPILFQQAPNGNVIQQGQRHILPNPAQLRPLPISAGLRAPYPTSNESSRANMPAMPNESQDFSQKGRLPTQRGLDEKSQHEVSIKIKPNQRQAASPDHNRRGPTSAQDGHYEISHHHPTIIASPSVSQPAAQSIELNSLEIAQQQRGGYQRGDSDGTSTVAKPQDERQQSITPNLLPQAKYPGAINPFQSNARAPHAASLPSIGPARPEPPYRQKSAEGGKANEMAGKERPLQQAARLIQNQEHPEQIFSVPSNQVNFVPQSISGNSRRPGATSSGMQPLGDQRRGRVPDRSEDTTRMLRNPPSQRKVPPEEQDPPIVLPHTPKERIEPHCQHKAHSAGASPQEDQGNPAVKDQRATGDAPSPVSGPQQMLNLFKARSQVSIDAASGCPGFLDRKSPWPIVGYYTSDKIKLTCSWQTRDDPITLQNGARCHA